VGADAANYHCGTPEISSHSNIVEMELALTLSSQQPDFYQDQPLDGDALVAYFGQNHVAWPSPTLAYRSRSTGFIEPEPVKNPNNQDWEDIRPIFTRLYSTENKWLKDVQDILSREHGFVATYGTWPVGIVSWSRG
jgi:Clr5 domain